MGWIKRNLFFVIGGVIALVLLGGSGFYIYQGWSRNSAAADALNGSYETLKTLADKKPGPGNGQVDNTQIAKDQEKQVHDWILSATGYFQPIAAIPADAVTSESFAEALRRTVAQLQSEAQNASVTLPPKYDFSFAAEQNNMQFDPTSLPLLAGQLGEIKAIAEIIYSAKVNALDGIQRARVSADDASGPQADYLNKQSVTNQWVVVTPYIISFHSFSPEIAHLISAFATSSNSFIVKSINVQPGAEASAEGMQPEMQSPGMGPGEYPPHGYGGYPPGHFPGQYPGHGYFPPGQMPPDQMPPATSRGGLQTVLKEQLLQVTMEVDLVKLLPKS